VIDGSVPGGAWKFPGMKSSNYMHGWRGQGLKALKGLADHVYPHARLSVETLCDPGNLSKLRGDGLGGYHR
jgi:hypothetical protein